MEPRQRIKVSKKRKSEDEYNPQIASKLLQCSDIQLEDLNHEIEQKLKKLRLNSSPMMSPKVEQTILCNFRRFQRPETITEERKEIEEETPITPHYQEVNEALGQIYFENKAMRGENNVNNSTISSRDSLSLLDIEFEADDETRNNIEEFYRVPNKILQEIWRQRIEERMME